jgi:hypothetical protein
MFDYGLVELWFTMYDYGLVQHGLSMFNMVNYCWMWVDHVWWCLVLIEHVCLCFWPLLIMVYHVWLWFDHGLLWVCHIVTFILVELCQFSTFYNGWVALRHTSRVMLLRDMLCGYVGTTMWRPLVQPLGILPYYLLTLIGYTTCHFSN